MYCWSALSFIPAMYFASHIYIPVFYNLQVTSVYEYLEMRFNRPTRILGACCYILQMVLYMSVVLYAPSLAVSAVTGLNTWVSVVSIGVVCTFYTALGGMKAVMWTDTLQALIMFMGILAVIIQGFINQGWTQVWKDAQESGRSDMFESKAFDPNPLVRHTFWSLVVGGTVYWTGTYGTNQAQVQRALSVPTLRKAKLTYWLNLPGRMLIVVFGGLAGLIIYSHFKHCDPLSNGDITARDQLYPLFVIDVLGHLHGLPGLIVAAIACGALSTISSGLNSLSAVILTDIVQPFRAQPISDSKAAILSKVIAAVLGVVCILVTFIVPHLGTIIQVTTTLFGTCGGVIFGVFSLGMLFPCANGKGAFVGLFVSLVITMWIGLGARFNKSYVYKYPISTDGCLISNDTAYEELSSTMFNISSAFDTSISTTQLTATRSVDELIAESRSGVRAIYSISYQWLATIASTLCTLVGLLVSAVTGGTDRSTLNPKLISPVVDKFCCCLPSKIRRRFYCGVRYGNYDTDGTEATHVSGTEYKHDFELEEEDNKK